MAERIQVELVDDIDGSPAQQTVTFALDGVTYEIDLNDRHAQRLRSVLGRYIERAREAERERERAREQPAAPAKRQERGDRAARQANKQLTEQIRGAAQRTKERLHKQQDEHRDPAASGSPGSGSAAPGAESTGESEVPAAALLEQRANSDSSDQDQSKNPAVPAVSLPQFSSAVD